ncbi:hypothetical protein Tco_0674612 [Tanacetum coccineum]
MHNFTSFIIDDEVTGLVKEYAIPLDLYPRALSLVLTMNNLSVSAIDAMLWRYHDFNISDPLPSGVNTEDVCGYHLTFKDSEGNVVTSMSGFLKFPMAQGVQIGHGTVLQPNKRYEALNDDYGKMYQAHSLCKGLSQSLTDTQTTHRKLFVPRWPCRNTIRLYNKSTWIVTAEKVNDQLKGNLERLTVDLSQAKVFRHNYIRQLLPTVFQRLLTSEEYKKSLLEPFNQAIIIGWSEGVLVDRTEEKAQAILTTGDDYDSECHAKFKSAFDRLFVKSYPYVEKLVASFHSRWAIYKTCDQRVKVKPWVAEPSMSRESLRDFGPYLLIYVLKQCTYF